LIDLSQSTHLTDGRTDRRTECRQQERTLTELDAPWK